MKEIYFIQNNLLATITLRQGHESADYINLNSLDAVVNYFKKDSIGKTLTARKNLNIILQIEEDSKRKLLEEKLSSIGFKRAYISYELPYEHAKHKYPLISSVNNVSAY